MAARHRRHDISDQAGVPDIAHRHSLEGPAAGLRGLEEYPWPVLPLTERPSSSDKVSQFQFGDTEIKQEVSQP